ncbi:uncharacterized protein, YigZ family [Melghirimyces thermohalophilus]|uniref:Uncharacterized protein, YigZ family n=1 Tax=Melghirimyces thermohalophilus TaxID=1236220 RepID=A0A1G6QQG1_9BACL|nr:YigZ family protein [Melghirimyces thermohalophilus]SDC93986.1 uncharacterized protein, YigZ family [Melghirimyces thermohalophilus]
MNLPYRYFTVKESAETEIHIQKSRFLTYVAPVETKDEADAFIDHISRRHWDATHNCHAYVLWDGQIAQKSSDDGEPSGTAGRPILEVIRNRQLINTAIVVTRYFGGIKLGAGGLIRAYSRAAATGLDAAGILEWVRHRELHITVDYPAMGKIEHELRSAGIQPPPATFTEQVQWQLWIPEGEEDPIRKMVMEQTGGKGEVTEGRLEYRPIQS